MLHISDLIELIRFTKCYVIPELWWKNLQDLHHTNWNYINTSGAAYIGQEECHTKQFKWEVSSKMPKVCMESYSDVLYEKYYKLKHLGPFSLSIL